MGEKTKEKGIVDSAADFVVKHKFIIIVLTAVFVTQLIALAGLKYLPGPLYGGDIYRERGFTEHIYQGYPIFEDPQIKGESAFRPQLGYIIIAGLAKLGIGTIDKVMLYVVIFYNLAYCLGIYLIAKELFSKEYIAISAALLGYGMIFISSIKFTTGFGFMFTIFFLYFMIKSIKYNLLKDKIAAGVCIGFSCLCHLQHIINIAVLLGSLIIFEGIYWIAGKKEKEEKKGKEKKSSSLLGYVKTVFRAAGIPVTIGAAISLVYFLPLFLLGRYKILNRVNEYAGIDINTISLKDALESMLGRVVNFSGVAAAVLSIIILLGLIYVFLNFKKTKPRLVAFAFIGAFLASIHFFITRPLFNFWITPDHVFDTFQIVRLGLLLFGIAVLFHKFKKLRIVVLVLILILSSFLIIGKLAEYRNSTYPKEASKDQPWLNENFAMRDWILKNTGKYEIFLSNDETAFAINALSARKVVMMRRVHASQYVDIDKRYADGIVMLYGKDREKVNELVKEYGVKYVVLDSATAASEIATDIKYADYLEQNGVSFVTGKIRWDLSVMDSRLIDSVIVPPQNITLFDNVPASQVYQNSNVIIAKLII
ncbi:MAG: glycosyltransferase family 39 protein [Candidatus Woesearchaeota archaeon]